MQDTPPAAAPSPPLPNAPIHEALSLTKGGPVAHIALDGQVYVLRITRGGKLILTK